MITYTLPQVPTSKLSVQIGCRFSVPISLAICAISSLLTPYSAYMGWQYVVVLRMINGVGASAVLPMLLNLVETWMRYNEISLGLSVGQMVNAFMCTLTPLISGYLSAIHWSLSFYVPGAITLVFCVLWIILVSDSPEQSKFISEKELLHIHSVDTVDAAVSARPEADDKDNNNQPAKAVMSREEDEQEYKADSWTQILKVPSFYAYIIMWCFYCSSYSGFTFILPTYMRQFLKIKVAQNGFYCFLIQMGTILSILWPHPLLRMLQNRGFSITASRIISHFILCSMVAGTWCYVGLAHNSQIFVLFLNRAAHSGNDVIVTGSLMSNYAKAGLSSVAFALVNTVGNLSIVGTSTLIGWALDYTNQSAEGWSWIFCGLGMSQVAFFLMFAIFVDSDPIRFKKSTPQKDVEGSQNFQQDTKNEERRSNNFEEMKRTAAKIESKVD